MPSARATDHVVALELIFQHLPPSDRAERIADALPLLEAADKHHLHLLVAHHDGAVIGAMPVQALPGGMGIVWPPAAAPDRAHRTSTEDALVAEARDWLRAHGAHMAQALVPVDEVALAEPLLRNGFTHPTRLWYLRHELELTGELLVIPERLSFAAYRAGNRDAFHRTLLSSYIGTADFPELNDRRSLDDVLRGLQASGFDPERWWLVRAGTTPVGVLLLAGANETWELVYAGVVPEQRRRGYGMELIRHAIVEAEAGSTHALTVSVDARNEPASRLYRRMNFETFGSREVFLALW